MKTKLESERCLSPDYLFANPNVNAMRDCLKIVKKRNPLAQLQ